MKRGILTTLSILALLTTAACVEQEEQGFHLGAGNLSGAQNLPEAEDNTTTIPNNPRSSDDAPDPTPLLSINPDQPPQGLQTLFCPADDDPTPVTITNLWFAINPEGNLTCSLDEYYGGDLFFDIDITQEGRQPAALEPDTRLGLDDFDLFTCTNTDCYEASDAGLIVKENIPGVGIEFEFWYSPDEHGRDSGIPAYKGLVNLADCGAMTD